MEGRADLDGGPGEVCSQPLFPRALRVRAPLTKLLRLPHNFSWSTPPFPQLPGAQPALTLHGHPPQSLQTQNARVSYSSSKVYSSPASSPFIAYFPSPFYYLIRDSCRFPQTPFSGILSLAPSPVLPLLSLVYFLPSEVVSPKTPSPITPHPVFSLCLPIGPLPLMIPTHHPFSIHF